MRCEQHRIGMMKERLRDSKVRPALVCREGGGGHVLR